MASLDEVLSGVAEHAETAVGAVDAGTAGNTGETKEAPQPAGESQAEVASGTDTPPVSETDKLVPLKALEEERKGRQDWKEKAIRFEEENKHLRTQTQQAQGQGQQQQSQPLSPDMAILNERMNMSEMILREKHADVDDKLAVFQAEVAKNPALGAELAKQRHPWDWMYKQAQRMQALAEIGEDPAAYRERIKAEIQAELAGGTQVAPAETQQAATTQAAPVVLPKSLATSRSAGPRSAPTWSGPTSLNDILKPRS